MATTREALKSLRFFPKLSLNNIKPRFPKRKDSRKVRQGGRGDRGQARHSTLPRIGFEGGNTPFYLKIPKEPYYKNHHLRKEYVPLSLLQLQRMIELGRVDTDKPIDLAALCNTKLVELNMRHRPYGIHITDEGADLFDSQVYLEVQWIDELAVAAIERAGSIIKSRYYDIRSVDILSNTQKFFETGNPIPTAKTPTTDVLEYYSGAKGRGYLADKGDIEQGKKELAQQYGYQLPEVCERVQQLADMPKSTQQIFYGLQPGWIINMPDQEIIKPTDPKLVEFYNTETML